MCGHNMCIGYLLLMDQQTNKAKCLNMKIRVFSIILLFSKKSINFKDFFEINRIFCLLGPSLRTRKLGPREIFLLHTNWGFQKNSTLGEYINKIQEASLGWTKMEKKQIGMTRVTVIVHKKLPITLFEVWISA